MVTTPQLTDEEVFARCERFLGGHGRNNPREELEALASATGPEEQPDRYGKGDVVEDFEREVAQILGTESALFLPSGTMAQQIALRIWSERKHCATVAFHPMCHLETKEEKGYERLHGLHAHLVGDARRLLTLADLEGIAEPIAALLIELPQRDLGGQMPPWDALVAQCDWARRRGAALHLDGARVWEAAPAYGRSHAEVCSLFDSVYVSFYKGVGAITGAALAGTADFIAEARVWQVRHGGRLLHAYPYVLSARMRLRQRFSRFAGYHERALAIAAALRDIPGVVVKPDPPHAHMMHIYLRGDIAQIQERALRLAREEQVLLFRDLRPTDLPDWWMFELSVGDAADRLSDAEVREYFTRVVGG